MRVVVSADAALHRQSGQLARREQSACPSSASDAAAAASAAAPTPTPTPTQTTANSVMAAVARMMSALALRCARQHAAYMAAAPARSSKAAAEPAAAAGGGAGRLPIHPQHQQLLQSRSRRLRLADAPAAGAGLGAATAPSHPTAASGGLQQSRPQDVAWDAQIFDSSSALVATATMHPPTLSPLDEASLGAFHEAWEKAAVRPLQASAALADTTGINIAAAIRKIAQDYDWPLEDEAAAAAAAAGTPAHAIVLAACCPLPPLPGSAAASTKAHKAAAKQALDTLLPRELRELLAQRRIALIWLDCSGAASSPNITDVRQQLAAQLFKHAGSALVDIDLVLSGPGWVDSTALLDAILPPAEQPRSLEPTTPAALLRLDSSSTLLPPCAQLELRPMAVSTAAATEAGHPAGTTDTMHVLGVVPTAALPASVLALPADYLCSAVCVAVDGAQRTPPAFVALLDTLTGNAAALVVELAHPATHLRALALLQPAPGFGPLATLTFHMPPTIAARAKAEAEAAAREAGEAHAQSGFVPPAGSAHPVVDACSCVWETPTVFAARPPSAASARATFAQIVATEKEARKTARIASRQGKRLPQAAAQRQLPQTVLERLAAFRTNRQESPLRRSPIKRRQGAAGAAAAAAGEGQLDTDTLTRHYEEALEGSSTVQSYADRLGALIKTMVVGQSDACADLLDYLVLEVVSEFDKLLHELLFDDDHADDVSIRQVELQVIARYAIMNLQRKMEDGSSSQDRSKEKARVLESECEGLMQEIQPEIELSLGNGEEHISSFLNDTLFRNFPILDAELASLYSGLEMRPPPALHSAALVAELLPESSSRKSSPLKPAPRGKEEDTVADAAAEQQPLPSAAMGSHRRTLAVAQASAPAEEKLPQNAIDARRRELDGMRYFALPKKKKSSSARKTKQSKRAKGKRQDGGSAAAADEGQTSTGSSSRKAAKRKASADSSAAKATSEASAAKRSRVLARVPGVRRSPRREAVASASAALPERREFGKVKETPVRFQRTGSRDKIKGGGGGAASAAAAAAAAAPGLGVEKQIEESPLRPVAAIGVRRSPRFGGRNAAAPGSAAEMITASGGLEPMTVGKGARRVLRL